MPNVITDKCELEPSLQTTQNGKLYRIPYGKALEEDIWDNYNANRTRFIDRHRDIQFCKNITLSPNKQHLVDDLASVNGVIRSVYVIPIADIKTRGMAHTYVYFDMEPLNKRPYPTDKETLEEIECNYFVQFASFLTNEDWYRADLEYCEEAKLESRGPKVRFESSFSGIVPDVAVVGMHYRACTMLCKHLEPLVFFLQAVMTDVLVDKDEDSQHWLAIEKTALLVIFFLRYCKLLPNLVKETKMFDRSLLTWQHMKEWDAGKPFFTQEYVDEQKREAAKSPAADFDVAELFTALLEFYTVKCPLKHGKFDFDNGKYKRSHNMKTLVIRTSLIKYPKEEDSNFLEKSFCGEILFKMLFMVREAKGNTPADDLIKLRRDEMAKRLAEKGEKPLPEEPLFGSIKKKNKKNNK